MPQTLRKTFSYTSHIRLKPALRSAFEVPFALPVLMQQLQHYLKLAKEELLQPRPQIIQNILKEAGH